MLKNTWDLGPLNKLTFEEKQVMKRVLQKAKQKYERDAAEMFNNEKNNSVMISKEDHELRNEVMRRNTVLQI